MTDVLTVPTAFGDISDMARSIAREVDRLTSCDPARRQAQVREAVALAKLRITVVHRGIADTDSGDIQVARWLPFRRRSFGFRLARLDQVLPIRAAIAIHREIQVQRIDSGHADRHLAT